VPVSLVEELSGEQQEGMHTAEVQELFAQAEKMGLEHESLSEQDILNSFIVPGVPLAISEAAAQHMMSRMDADGDGQISWAESMNFVRTDSRQRVSGLVETSSMLEKEASTESTSAQAQVEQMRVNATLTMMKILQEQEAKEDAKKQLREKRWKNMLERQKASLVEREKLLKKQQKDVERLDREERWQEAQKKQSNFLQKKACASQDVHAFLTTPNTAHAKCLKLQLGECAAVTQVHAPALLQCNEISDGWQKNCLNERTQEAAQCAPAGVNWEALKKGATGTDKAVDNHAIQNLRSWCTLYTSLAQVKQGGAQGAWAALLDQDAAVSNDFMSEIQDFVRQNQEASLVEIDGPHSVAVRTDAAGLILEFMQRVKAMPVSDLIAFLQAEGIPTKAMDSKVAGAINLSLVQKSEDLATNGLLCSPHRL